MWICLCLTSACPCPVLSSLQALTHVAAEDEVASNLAAAPGGSLLELEQYHAGQRRKLLVLQLVATLCENISDTVFTDVAQVGHDKPLGDQLEHVADRALGCWALRRQWLRNSWRKVEHPQEKQLIDSVVSQKDTVLCSASRKGRISCRDRTEKPSRYFLICVCGCVLKAKKAACVLTGIDLPPSLL